MKKREFLSYKTRTIILFSNVSLPIISIAFAVLGFYVVFWLLIGISWAIDILMFTTKGKVNAILRTQQ